MLLKISKNSTKSKAVSSYMLSGINIKRMIQDEMASSDNNASDISIIRVSKRPIFKLKEKDREKEREKENNTSVTSSLPNKSFKIRSYTRKMKDGKEEESCEIFQKVDKVRNCRTNSNRIQLFNLSRENREKDESQQRIQTKIRQILQREATIKCKANNQVFVKQPAPKLAVNPAMNYQQINNEKYRDMAHKVNVFFNPQFEDQSQKKTLLIVSIEGMTIQAKRLIKNSNTTFEEPAKNIEKTSIFSQQQVELLKMLSSKHYPDAVWKQTKLVFKVNTAQEMQQLKNVLQSNHINDYFCIFYPIKKYVECWNLYQIDGLLNNNTTLILLQAKHKLREEFPIINAQAKVLFIVTNNDNFVMLSRTLAAIKCFISQKLKQPLPVQDVDEEVYGADEQSKQEERLKVCGISISEFGLREEQIDINWKKLDAKLQFTINSQQMKNSCRNQTKQGYSNKERSKRRVLCERDNNCPLTASKNNRIMCFNSASVDDKWQIQPPRQQSIDTIKQNLLFCLRTQRLKEVMNQNQDKVAKNIQCTESKGQKGDQLDEITNYVRGSFCRSKTTHQLISELLKKNTVIHRQIQQYISTVGHLIQPTTNNSNNNKSVSIFNDQTQEDFPSYQEKTQMPTIVAYKIF